MIPLAHITHVLPNRVRIRVPEKRHDSGYFASLVNAFDALPGIEGVKVNALTASLLLKHRPMDVERISEFAAQRELFRINPGRDGQDAVVPLSTKLTSGMQVLDDKLRAHSGGRLDFWSALFLLLIGLSISQFAKGNIFAPASTLLWYAIGTLTAPRQAGTSIS